MKMKAVSLLAVSVLLLFLAVRSTAVGFNCTSSSTCRSMIGYNVTNATTVREIRELFDLHTSRSLLAANSLPVSTPSNHSFPAGLIVRVPFPCRCSNGTGISNHIPVYTVQPGDYLDRIAEIFDRFVTSDQIGTVNNIANLSLIVPGLRLRIPLPCSCDKVDGADVVHYGHVVASGSTVGKIAEQFGTTQQTLLQLNGIADPKLLLAGQILDVPLKACSSAISNTSLDNPLLVPARSYALTANNCVQCSCNLSNPRLFCEPAQGVNRSSLASCPSMRCEGSDLYLGNVTVLSTCRSTVCSYAGYTAGGILTTLVNQSTCPTNVAPASPPSGNSGSRLGLQWWNWRWLFVSLNMVLLCFARV